MGDQDIAKYKAGRKGKERKGKERKGKESLHIIPPANDKSDSRTPI